MDALLFQLELLLYMEDEHEHNLAESESRQLLVFGNIDGSDPAHPPYLIMIEEQYGQELIAYYQMVYYQMLEGMGSAMTWDYDDMGPAAHPEPPPVHTHHVGTFVARELARSRGGDNLLLRVSPLVIAQREGVAAIKNILDISGIKSAGAILLAPVHNGDGIAQCFTHTLTGIAGTHFAGGRV